MGTSYDYNLLTQKHKKFYSDLTMLTPIELMNIPKDNLSEKVNLIISINKIKVGCSYKIKLFDISNGQKISLNEITECQSQDNKKAFLNTQIIINYFFEKEQPLLIEISRKDEIEKIDKIKTTLGNVIVAFEKKISSFDDEILIIKAEKKKNNEDVIKFSFEISPPKDKEISFKSIKYKMYYEVYCDKGILYRSECLIDKGKKGIFNPVKIPVCLFPNEHLIVIFYKSSRKERKRLDLSISEFIKFQSAFQRVNGAQLKITSKSEISKKYTFVDYLTAGMKISLSVAIDFTGSNGNPKDRMSLHYIHGKEPNQYQKAISSCGNIISQYTDDKLFPCFGFGAKINNKSAYLFNLNFDKNPKIKEIQGIIDAYHNAFQKVELWGPTYFCPIIRKINEMIENEKENNKLNYHILMILTDGIIDDMKETIDELVKSSSLPLSIIIIGVGKEDFSSMEILDADENPLIDTEGKICERDLVQFVPFLKFQSDAKKLANEVLAEIPGQVIEYYENNNLKPSNLNSQSINI